MRGRAIYRATGWKTGPLTTLAVLLALGALTPVSEAKPRKGRMKSPAVSRTATVALPPGSQQSATATCAKGTHISGGGFSVSPAYSAGGTDSFTDDTGTRSVHLQSQSAGNRRWTAGAAAFSSPTVAGSLSAIARCERNDLGRLAVTLSGSSTIPVGQGNTTTLTCPAGTHVLTGGFAGSPPGNLADPAGKRLIITESRRVSNSTWEIRAINPLGAPSVATLFTNAVCERNGKRGVFENSALTPITDNGRTSLTAPCPSKKHHVVSGGFLVSPFASPIPGVGIDQHQPAGRRAWQVGLHEFPTFPLPTGSLLTTYAYCKRS
jgi:hypothetical protein